MEENAKQTETKWHPTPAQAKVLQTARELGFDITKVAVAKKSGVSRATLYRWLDGDPNFKEAWVNSWSDLLDNHFPAIVSAQIKKAKKGDTQAARLTSELVGHLKNRLEVTGKDGAPIEHDHSTLDSRLADIASRKGQGNDAGASDRTGKT